MSLSQSLRLTEDRLDQASATLDQQMDYIRSELTEEENLGRDVTQKLVKNMLKAERSVRNSETQFLNYQIDMSKAIDGGKALSEIPETYDLQPTAEEYRRTYESARQVVDRYDALESKFRALSQIMDQNDLGNPREQRKIENNWYNEEEMPGSGFQSATELQSSQ